MKPAPSGAPAERPLILSLTAAFFALTIGTALAALLLSGHMAQGVARDESEKARASACAELASLTQVLSSAMQPRVVDVLQQHWTLPERSFRYRYRTADKDDAVHVESGLPAEIPDRLDPAGTIPAKSCFGSKLNPDLEQQLAHFFRPDVTLGTFPSDSGVLYITASLWRLPGRGSYDLQVAAPVTQPAIERAKAEALKQGLLWALLALSTAGGGLVLNVLYRRRVAALSAVFERLQRGDWQARPAPSRRRDELAVLGEQIAGKLDLIESQVYAIERVGVEIAHELAQPLSSLVLKVFNARALATDAAAWERLDRIYQELAQLRPVLNELLDLGRSIGLGGAAGVRFETIDLSALLAGLVAAAGDEAAAKGIGLDSALQPGVLVHGSQTMLRVLFGNLLGNAIKYTDQGRVTVSLGRGGDSFVATIRDTGPGLPAGAAARLATPFYRVPGTGDKQGHGIGMTLVHTIAARHGFMLPPPRSLEPGLEVSVTGSTFTAPAG